jgi:uncharacterized coiled-coil DUF342 family protein
MPTAKEKSKNEGKKGEGKAKSAAPPKGVENPLKDLKPPNKAKYNKDIAQKNASIERLQGSLLGIQNQLQEKNQDKDGFYEKKKELANLMQAYGEQIKKLNDQRKNLKDTLIGKLQNQKTLNKNLKSAQQSIQFKSEEELDSRIKAIEFEMFTGTLTLQEEKRKVQEIQQLKKQKPKINATREKVEALTQKQEELKEDTAIPDLDEQIKTVDTKVSDVWKAKEKVKEEYLALTQDRAKLEETNDLYKQKTEFKDQISALIRERNDLRKQLRDEEDEFRKAKQEALKLMAEKRKAQKEAAWEAELMEKCEENITVQPHLAEVALLEQTITFCKNLLPKEKGEEEAKKETSFNNPEGYAVLKNKNDRDEEFYMTASKKKGLAKKNKAAPSQTIKHDAWTFQQFDALKIKAPNTTKEIPDTLAQLQEKLDDFNFKISEWNRKVADGTLREEWMTKNRKLLEDAKKEEDEKAAEEAEKAAEEAEGGEKKEEEKAEAKA